MEIINRPTAKPKVVKTVARHGCICRWRLAYCKVDVNTRLAMCMRAVLKLANSRKTTNIKLRFLWEERDMLKWHKFDANSPMGFALAGMKLYPAFNS